MELINKHNKQNKVWNVMLNLDPDGYDSDGSINFTVTSSMLQQQIVDEVRSAEREVIRLGGNHMIVRDPKYIRYLKSQPCLLTGARGGDGDPIDPMHIGTAGKAIKVSDTEALPVRHSLHTHAHQHGEVSMFRKFAPDWLIREALRAYAREMYLNWKLDEKNE